MSAPKVFISYSWETQEHQDRVLGLADWLESSGIEVIFDQYEPNPEKPWPQWMEEGIRLADFVLCICTTSYKTKVDQSLPASTGLGLQWEGSLIYNSIASKQKPANAFQVLQFDNEDLEAIPSPLAGNNRHIISAFTVTEHATETLYRVITDQPRAKRPTRGELIRLEPVPRAFIPRSGAELHENKIEIRERSSSTLEDRKVSITPSVKRPTTNRSSDSFRAAASAQMIKHARREMSREHYREAVSFGLRAHQFDPENPEVARLIGDGYYHLCAFTQSLQWLERAAAHFTDDLGLQLRTLFAREQVGIISNALERGKELFKQSDFSEHNCRRYARFLSDFGLHGQAVQILLQIPAADRSFRTNAMIAVYYWFAGNTEKSVELLNALPKSEFIASDWLNLGVGLAELNRFGLAIEAIREGSKLDSDLEFAKFAIAQIYCLMGETKLAIDKLRELAKNDSVYLLRARTERTLTALHGDPEFIEIVTKRRD